MTTPADSPPALPPHRAPATRLERALVALLFLGLAFGCVAFLFPVALIFFWSANPQSQDGPLPPNWGAAGLMLVIAAALLAGTGLSLWRVYVVLRHGCTRPGALAWVGGVLMVLVVISMMAGIMGVIIG